VSCAGRRNSGIIVETWHSGSAPTSSRWLDAEWIAEVLAPRASAEVRDGALGDAALVRLALPQPHLRDRER
jgi:hypothetical protein